MPDTPRNGLIDPYARRIEYVRVSVTDRCDLRCNYCMPKGFDGFHEPDEWLTFDEIERVVAAFTRLGVERIRLTGGEPLVRHNLPDLAARLSALPGLRDLSLSTNAVRLDKYAAALKARRRRARQRQPRLARCRPLRTDHRWRQAAQGAARARRRPCGGLGAGQDQHGGDGRRQ
jgi:organic radical activating enzyme